MPPRRFTPRSALPILSVALALGFAAPAAAWTISQDTRLDCATGQVLNASGDVLTPSGTKWDAASKTLSVDSLVVAEGARLDVFSRTPADGSTDPIPCAITSASDILVSGTLAYDEGNGVTATNLAGQLTAGAAKKIQVDGVVGADGRDAGLTGTANGGPGGTIALRAPQVVVGSSGRVSARGGSGRNATVGNGGNGGAAGLVAITVDGAASFAGVMAAEAGSAGTAGTGGTAGAPGAGGTVRRNAFSGAGGGQAVASSRPVNQAPTGLTVGGASVGTLLSWRDNSSEETGFAVVRRESGGGWRYAGAVGPNITSFNNTGPFEVGKTYEYTVIPTFGGSVWPNAYPFSSIASIEIPSPQPDSGGGGAQDGSQGAPTPSGAFSVNRSFRSKYALSRKTRRLSMSIRSYGDGRLRVRLPVRVNRSLKQRRAATRTCRRTTRSKRARSRCLLRRKTRLRTLTRTVVVKRGVNRVRMTMPRTLRAGRYRMTLTTIAENGQRRTSRKTIRLSLKKAKRSKTKSKR